MRILSALVDVDGDRDRWTDAYVQKVKHSRCMTCCIVWVVFQALVDMPEVENIHISEV